MNWNNDIDVVTLRLKLIARRIDYDIEKTFRNVKTLHQVRALLHVGGHEGQPIVKARISLAGRSYHVLEKLVRRLARVSVEKHRLQHEARAFRDVQTQSIRRFNHVVHVHFRVAVLSIKNLKEECEIVRPSRT